MAEPKLEEAYESLLEEITQVSLQAYELLPHQVRAVFKGDDALRWMAALGEHVSLLLEEKVKLAAQVASLKVDVEEEKLKAEVSNPGGGL